MPVSPPRPKGPPLNALRAFEAAARLGGFAVAAEELCVTPGAISQHIKALEEWTGEALFERRSHGVRLTPAGARLQPEFTAAFDRIGQAVHTLREVSDHKTIHIAALPSLAQLWLSPRLPQLRRAFPGLHFSVTALEAPPNLLRDVFDWSIFIETPSDQNDELVLEEDFIFPVCAPSIAANVTRPEDLLDHPLIFDATWASDWDFWASAADWVPPAPLTGSQFSLYALALEEARNGAGVLMGHSSLIKDDIASGRLIMPLQPKVPTGRALILRSVMGRRAIADSFVTFE